MIRTEKTPYLVFSTYLGGSKPCEHCSDTRTFAQNAASDAQGNTYVTGATKGSDLPVLKAWQDKPTPDSRLSAFAAPSEPCGCWSFVYYLIPLNLRVSCLK